MPTYKNIGITKKAWEAIKKGYEECHKKYPDIKFNENKWDVFHKNFYTHYDNVMENFMKSKTETLDSHKQAAIITISCLESDIIIHELNNPNEISIVPQLIAVNAGLSYMKNCINVTLKKKKIGKKINKYYLPIAMSCNTPYEEIVCRILYYEQYNNDMDFNVLELADRYFLLEYITLLQRGIEPLSLKQEVWPE